MDGKLLYAHQSLMDLENCRDSLLFELHKHTKAPQGDQRLLTSYFTDISALSKELLKQINLKPSMWQTLYLESIRRLILEDLKVVNQLCAPVFPPDWNVCQMFLDL